MSGGGRVKNLEAAMPGAQGVQVWLTQAHAFGSMAAYCAWLIEQPETEAPMSRVPRQARAAVTTGVRANGAGTERQVDEAHRSACFLVQLVISLNVMVAETLEAHRLREIGLHWQLRALTLERALAREEHDARLVADSDARLARWAAAVRAHLVALAADEIARTALEARHLAGRPALWPDLRAETAALLKGGEELVAMIELACPDGGPDAADLRQAAQAAGLRRARDLLVMVRATVLDELGERARAMAAVVGLVRPREAPPDPSPPRVAARARRSD